ncbi:hypothetical protein ACJX0J_041718, partial [Zea mays]
VNIGHLSWMLKLISLIFMLKLISLIFVIMLVLFLLENMWIHRYHLLWVFHFAHLRQLPVLVPYIPIEIPQLSDTAYESLAELYVINGQYEKALSLYAELLKPEVFEFIEKYNLHDAIHDKIVNLMIVDNKRTVHLLIQHRDIILPYEVVEQLLHTSKKCDKRYLLHLYLHALFEIDIHAGKDFHDMQVELYADYETRMLLPFLRTSQHYRLNKAYEIFAQKELVREQVFVLGRMGNAKEALSTIINKLEDMQEHDDELWEELIRQCLQKPEMVGNLLEHTVGNLDPLYIVSLVPDGLEIPRLTVLTFWLNTTTRLGVGYTCSWLQILRTRNNLGGLPGPTNPSAQALSTTADQITMNIEVEKGNVDVGNTAEPSYEVAASSGCSAQLSTNDTGEHELDIESEDSKVSVGNAAKQSHDVVGVCIDCIFNPVKVSTKADLGPQSDVIHLTSLDVPNELSQISSDANMVEQNKQDALDTLIRISQHKKPKKLNVARVVSEDYKCTPEDVQLIEYIKTLPGKQVVVNIDSAWLNRNDMECLFHGDIQLSGEVLSAYIHCIRDEEHLLHREGGKVFLENTFISSLLKRDGNPKVFIPMNIENFHWYLAVLNAKKSELKGLERQIKLAAEHKELYQGKWSNLDVASWPVIEKITTQMQTDGVSCGLWMINYMEYWAGSSLSDNVTQDDITMFRFKLPAILWDSRLNTKKRHQKLDHNVDEDGESSSDVQIIDTPYNAKYLKKHWIQSTKPYPISLSLQKLKYILDVNKPMDTDCFNMAVRMIACNDALFLLEDKYHYMDLQFCILLPDSFLGHFTLYVLNMDTRSIYIMDSMPIPSWFKGDHPSMHYIYNIHYIANNMNAAMELANPTWKDDIYMWRCIVPTWVPRTLNWIYLVFLLSTLCTIGM